MYSSFCELSSLNMSSFFLACLDHSPCLTARQDDTRHENLDRSLADRTADSLLDHLSQYTQ